MPWPTTATLKAVGLEHPVVGAFVVEIGVKFVFPSLQNQSCCCACGIAREFSSNVVCVSVDFHIDSRDSLYSSRATILRAVYLEKQIQEAVLAF